MDDMTSSPYPPFNGVEPYGTVRSVAAERAHRKRMCALGYRIFGAMRWGMLGDGHVSARDPELTDHSGCSTGVSHLPRRRFTSWCWSGPVAK